MNFFRSRKIGVALGGGAALGASHVGVLRGLDETNHNIEFISGTSIGATVSAFHAFGWI
ncbi:MAG: patatin-like phospholipase family protein [Balneolaceae bacterium]|nr:patatin-like phospholipase family protein [Balneolaceae bacterium]